MTCELCVCLCMRAQCACVYLNKNIGTEWVEGAKPSISWHDKHTHILPFIHSSKWTLSISPVKGILLCVGNGSDISLSLKNLIRSHVYTSVHFLKSSFIRMFRLWGSLALPSITSELPIILCLFWVKALFLELNLFPAVCCIYLGAL